jgi:hypothetical protein
MGKKEDLIRLDRLVREKMISILDGEAEENLSDLTVVVQYLSKNNMIAEKPTSSVEEDTAKRLEAARRRREES